MITIPLVSVVLGGLVSATPLGPSALGPMGLFKRAQSGCSISGSASCHNTTHQADACCFESPGGLLLQTQFWDVNPSTGPSNSWTIHGLWPDNCDGTYEQDCDPSRAYTGLGSMLSAQGASDTLAFMNKFWVDINGQNEQFWEHEWSKHGTCYSTLEPSCFPSGSPKGAEAVAFFNTVVRLFKALPTYDWLAAAGITPSTSKTYTLSTLTSALKAAAGVTPALDCDGKNINQISWYYNVKGSVMDGNFVLINAPKAGSCASSGLLYPPKSGSPVATSTAGGSSSGPTGVPSGLPAKALLQASVTGGLLTAGTWSTQTPATFTISGSVSGFTLSTSKGNCGVSGNQFTCGSGVSASTFTAASSGSNMLLAYSGSTSFSSDASPSGQTQQTVYSGTGHSEWA